MQEQQLKKRYTITLKWGDLSKRLHLGGEDSDEAKEEFATALKEIDDIGDAAKTWEEFFSKAIDIFEEHGFVRIER